MLKILPKGLWLLAGWLAISGCGAEPSVDGTTTSRPVSSVATTVVRTVPTQPATSSAVTTTSTPVTTVAAERVRPVLVVEVVMTDLENPRGIGIDDVGALLVAEAGYGEDAQDLILRTGRLTRFLDRNGDGDYADPGEAERWLDNLYSFNSVNKYDTGQDEVSGATDVLVHHDGRVFLSLDGGIDESGGTFILFELAPDGRVLREISQNSNMTGIDFGPDQQSIYATQSTLNQLIEIDLVTGEHRRIVTFDDLYSGQYPPAWPWIPAQVMFW